MFKRRMRFVEAGHAFLTIAAQYRPGWRVFERDAAAVTAIRVSDQ